MALLYNMTGHTVHEPSRHMVEFIVTLPVISILFKSFRVEQ